MEKSKIELRVYLEAGNRRVFACALDWPGWCRSGRDETSALDALIAYGPRYARAISASGLDLDLPTAVSDLFVDERLEGNSTTDLGAPAAVTAVDARPMDDKSLDRLAALLKACWLAFSRTAAAAEGKPLRKGPRGGGRDLPRIVEHVAEANRAYLAKLAWKPAPDPGAAPLVQLGQMVDEVSRALAAAAAGELPTHGPRGGKLWPPRYFVRRAAWHLLDHAWEIEDRLE